MDLSDIVCDKELTFEEVCAAVRPIAARYGVRSVYLFGSRARGDNRDDSDYDFCIDHGKVTDPLQMCGLICDLESALRKRVDAVSEHALKPEILEEVLTDGRLVYKA
ncbi:MAG: nucleotidyltransferase domain-containing protein [Methanomassiliicoccaceae archaeon]|nr:nucleotidyltransferase domain-containing protein [Methanomassiliicoccaceae archaeon]